MSELPDTAPGLRWIAPPWCPDTLLIRGRRQLRGSIDLEGCKLSAVPMIAATLLTDQPIVLDRVPVMADLQVLCNCLASLGADVRRRGSTVRVACGRLDPAANLPDAWIASVHGTLYLLPTLLVRYGRVRMPRSRGGCRIGVRPVAQIADVLRAFGARVQLGDTIEASVPGRGLTGCRLSLDYGSQNNKFISGATKTAILAGVLARGETVIENAFWRQPIVELCSLLRAMGAEIDGDGTRRIRIRGVPTHRPARRRVPCDPLVLGTYSAAAAGGNEIRCRHASLDGLQVEAQAFRAMGIDLEADGEDVVAAGTRPLRPAALTTREISTDLGPLFAVLMTQASGRSRLEEVIWERRFRYAAGLRRLGGVNALRGRTLEVTGVPRLSGSLVEAHDLRGAAALLVAALHADGDTRVRGTAHLARGYEDLPGRLRTLGAEIRVWSEDIDENPGGVASRGPHLFQCGAPQHLLGGGRLPAATARSR
jgi:UDP-N-acetylglucosamine 1-carboxyvinyltransferase